MSMKVTRVPVLIVGAGVGGLAMSALLAKDGVSSLLIERRREVFIYPKARNISFRTFEILCRLGVGDAVHAVAERSWAAVVKATVNSAAEEPDMGMNALVSELVSEFDGLSPEPAVQFCPQSRSEPILLAEARRLGSEVRYGTELSSSSRTRTVSQRYCATGTWERPKRCAPTTWLRPTVSIAQSERRLASALLGPVCGRFIPSSFTSGRRGGNSSPIWAMGT